MLKKLVNIASILLLSVQAHAGIIAQFDGSIHINQSTYLNGYGSIGDANFVDTSAIQNLNLLGDEAIIKLTMGSYIDFFKPAEGFDLITMLISNDKHLWSSSADGTFIAPDYYHSHLGGSALHYPTDGRPYISFWGGGSDRPDLLGGCCSNGFDPNSWGLAFSIESVETQPINSGKVPIPATIWLLLFPTLLIIGTNVKSRA